MHKQIYTGHKEKFHCHNIIAIAIFFKKCAYIVITCASSTVLLLMWNLCILENLLYF